jgi:hypothetical protein
VMVNRPSVVYSYKQKITENIDGALTSYDSNAIS